MRQGQQNRRGRGRNRKSHHNPLTRSFESNGPDVKIRGTPAHIAEKYMSLARDALSSGDPVLAENYLQHAEHYNRIIMAFREQHVQQNGESMNGGFMRNRSQIDGMDGDEYGEDDGDDMLGEGFGQAPRGQEPQPVPQPRVNDAAPRFADRPRQNHHDGERAPRQNNHDHGRPPRERYQQEPRANSSYSDRQPVANSERPSGTAEPAPAESSPPPAPARSESPAPRRRERFVQNHEQPEFLRRPVRRPRREANGSDTTAEPNGAAEPDKAGTQDKS